MAPVFASTKHPRGWYPIHLAVLSGNIGLVKNILEKHVSGANATDTFNDTKSTEAVYERREEFGECGVGASTYKATPLHYACYMGNWDIIKLLIDNGAGFEEKEARRKRRQVRLAKAGKNSMTGGTTVVTENPK